MAIMLSGCAVGPEFNRPGLNFSKEWLEASDMHVVNKTGDYHDWWKAFNDPVLSNLITKAYKENLSLKIAGTRVLEARAELGLAGEDLFPQTQDISGSLQYERLSPYAGNAIQKKKFAHAEFTGSAIWELDFWGKFRRQIQSAKSSWLATIADYNFALVTLSADTASFYIKIRTLEKRLSIAEQNVVTQKESLRIAEERLNNGTATELDVEQAKTILGNTLSLIPAMETQMRQYKDALCVLLGMPPEDLSGILKETTGIPVSPIKILVGIPQDLLRRRPDIRSAEYEAMAQCAQIGVAKSELYPAFTLNGTFGFSASDIGASKLRDIFRWKSHTYGFGPSFEWNIFNYGRIANNVRLQDARFQELILNYQNKVLAAQQEVEDNLIAFLKTQERAQYLEQSVSAAENTLDLATKQYRQGTRDFTTVLVAQQSLLNEQDSLAAALGDISTSLIEVYRALGGGWEIHDGG